MIFLLIDVYETINGSQAQEPLQLLLCCEVRPIGCDQECAELLQSCPTLCDPMDWALCSPPGSVHGVLQARILKWLSCPPPQDLPNPGTKLASLISPLQVGSLPLGSPGKPDHGWPMIIINYVVYLVGSVSLDNAPSWVLRGKIKVFTIFLP